MTTEKIIDYGNEVHVKKARTEAQSKYELLLRAIGKVMDTKEGRKVLYEVISMTGQHRTCMGKDPHETYFFLGQRNIGLKLTAILTEANQELYLKSLVENKGGN